MVDDDDSTSYQFELLTGRNPDGTCDIHLLNLQRDHLDVFFRQELRDLIETRLMAKEFDD